MPLRRIQRNRWQPGPLGMAAEQGLGIGVRLVPLLDDQATSPTPVHLLLPGGSRLPARTRAFIDFVQPRLAQALAGAGLA
jgi:DNA-binding transcriptional LysR family regulator